MKIADVPSALELLEPEELAMIKWRLKWKKSAREKQLTPEGTWWTTHLCSAGRGFGKTRMGAEDIAWYAATNPSVRCGVIAPTSNDVRGVCFEGESGLMSVLPPEIVESYNKSLLEIKLKNGSLIRGFSAEEPGRLRGPQFHRVWADELAAWQRIDETWDMLKFCLRLGENPQILATTTPKPLDLIRRLVKEAQDDHSSVILTTGSTYENEENLAPSFIEELKSYEGTNLGRQEIWAEILDPEEAGVVKRSWFKLWPDGREFPRFEYVLQAYDTAFTERTTGDPTACSVWAVFKPTDKPMSVMLLDCWSDHLSYPDLKPRVLEDYTAVYGSNAEDEDDYSPSGKKVDLVLIEEKGSGISLLQDLQRAGVSARGYNPGKADKITRLHIVSNIIKAGRVYIPESSQHKGQFRSWVNPFMEQVCSFPLATHDDFVDTLSMALRYLRDIGFLNIDPVQEEDYYEEDTRARRENPYAM
jgi:predicted phage terminase large subunit-like protein